MSYDLLLFKVDSKKYSAEAVKSQLSSTKELSLDMIIIPLEDKHRIVINLINDVGFKTSIINWDNPPDYIELTFNDDSQAMQIGISKDQIGISIPYWENNKTITGFIKRVLRIINESSQYYIWDSQTGIVSDGPEGLGKRNRFVSLFDTGPGVHNMSLHHIILRQAIYYASVVFFIALIQFLIRDSFDDEKLIQNLILMFSFVLVAGLIGAVVGYVKFRKSN